MHGVKSSVVVGGSVWLLVCVFLDGVTVSWVTEGLVRGLRWLVAMVVIILRILVAKILVFLLLCKSTSLGCLLLPERCH